VGSRAIFQQLADGIQSRLARGLHDGNQLTFHLPARSRSNPQQCGPFVAADAFRYARDTLDVALAWARARSLPVLLLLLLASVSGVQAQTINEVLAGAYQRNPRLNAERARLRATDETVPQALAAYRPHLAAYLSTGLQGVRNLLPDLEVLSDQLRPSIASLTVNQTVFNGLQTANTTRQAEAKVNAGRATLRTVEQDVLLDSATAYMAVLSSQALVEALRANVTFLRELLSTTNKRYEAGDVTPTDVAQAQARLNRGLADLNNAEVALAASRATFIQVNGVPAGHLVPTRPVDELLPGGRDASVAMAVREHPIVQTAMFDIDIAQLSIQIAQAALYPTGTVQASASTAKDTDPTLGFKTQNQASVVGNLTVPVYDGGLVSARVRQAKEILGQTRIWLERVRARAETAAIAAWVTYQGSRVFIEAAESEVKAATAAVEGVQKEAQAGQRTTLNVLNAQQDLIAARARLILAQRDRVVASYTLLSAIGRLNPAQLGLRTLEYDSETHYQQVRDLPANPNTPSGQ
jgi:outer membrane protein